MAAAEKANVPVDEIVEVECRQRRVLSDRLRELDRRR